MGGDAGVGWDEGIKDEVLGIWVTRITPSSCLNLDHRSCTVHVVYECNVLYVLLNLSTSHAMHTSPTTLH